MKRAFILIGPSGSGKSTVRRELERKHEGVMSFSLDDVRIKFFLENAVAVKEGLTEGDIYGKAFDYCNDNKAGFDAAVKSAWASARQSQVVIVDNVHGTRKSRAPWVADLRKDKFHITMVQVQTPLSVILERQKTRGDKEVPANIVRSMYMRQEEALVGSECDEVLVIDGTKPWKA